MHSHVLEQVVPHGECLSTYVTTVISLPRVCQHMILQHVLVGKLFVANFATVRLITRVSQQVLAQTPCLHEGSGAYVTLIRFEIVVGSHVHLKTVLVLETSGTVLAFEIS